MTGVLLLMIFIPHDRNTIYYNSWSMQDFCHPQYLIANSILRNPRVYFAIGKLRDVLAQGLNRSGSRSHDSGTLKTRPLLKPEHEESIH